MRIGVDTGGTFTDLVLAEDGHLRQLKIPSTPEDPAAAVLHGVHTLLQGVHTAQHDVIDVIHGTTVATNALLERRGGPTALIATRGFEDVLLLRRHARPQLYALHPVVPPPLVEEALRIGIGERLAADGDVLVAIDPAELEALAARLEGEVARGAVRSIAVALLHSYANDAHERAIAERLARLGVPVSRSSEVLPEHREYERTSTAVIDAYVAPVVSGYLARIEAGLDRGALRVMQSAGTAAAAGEAARRPARTILSGPAAGVVGARAVCARAGVSRFITFDVGGTSTDVSLVDGALVTSSEGEIAGHPVRVPSLAVHTVGAGGGSIAWRDEGGALRVGPRSAGATPGPACYGLGGVLPTVTDALLLLGRLSPAHAIGGRALDEAAARAALAPLAESLGLSIEATAAGVAQVTVALTARAIRVISVEKGHDPRDFALCAFGGAGGLVACEVAEEVGCARVLVPPGPGLLCAYGALAADVGRDYTHTRLQPAGASLVARGLDLAFAPLLARAAADLDAEGVPASARRFVRRCDLRYAGQSYELSVELPEEDPDFDLLAAFHGLHARRYGFADPGRAVEEVALRVQALGLTDAPPPLRVEFEQGDPCLEERAGARVLARARLRPGAIVEGPAVVVEYSGTTFVPAGWRGEVDGDGLLSLARR